MLLPPSPSPIKQIILISTNYDNDNINDNNEETIGLLKELTSEIFWKKKQILTYLRPAPLSQPLGRQNHTHGLQSPGCCCHQSSIWTPWWISRNANVAHVGYRTVLMALSCFLNRVTTCDNVSNNMTCLLSDKSDFTGTSANHMVRISLAGNSISNIAGDHWKALHHCHIPKNQVPHWRCWGGKAWESYRLQVSNESNHVPQQRGTENNRFLQCFHYSDVFTQLRLLESPPAYWIRLAFTRNSPKDFLGKRSESSCRHLLHGAPCPSSCHLLQRLNQANIPTMMALNVQLLGLQTTKRTSVDSELPIHRFFFKFNNQKTTHPNIYVYIYIYI